ncbi:MAG TPA: alpha/beta fold hydrolase [archaeon]|nr:alpha/beta fold hydrolase [archaeon]
MKKVYFNTTQNHGLCGVFSGRGSAVIIYCHGWTGDKNSRTVAALKNKLNGFTFFSFDFYGHGESSGQIGDMTVKEGIEDVMAAAKCVKSLGYAKIVLVGSSFGGLCAVLAAKKVKPAALVLKSPVSLYKENMLNNKGKEFIKSYKIYNAHKAAKYVKCPVLIFHGDRDERVPLEQSKRLARELKNSELVVVKGMKHDYTKRNLAAMANETGKFLEQIKL